MGLKKFGPLHVIFIMGCQTLVIPGLFAPPSPFTNLIIHKIWYWFVRDKKLAIFSIIQYYSSIPAMSSNVLTLVAIFLPLSSLWASKTTRSAASKHHRPASPPPSSPPAHDFRAKQVFSSSSALLFTESDRVENCTPVNRVNHGGSVASSLGFAEGQHEIFALQDLEKQGLRWKARHGFTAWGNL